MGARRDLARHPIELDLVAMPGDRPAFRRFQPQASHRVQGPARGVGPGNPLGIPEGERARLARDSKIGVQQLSRQVPRIDFDPKQELCRPGHHRRRAEPCQTPNRQHQLDRSDQKAMAAKSHAGTLKASEAPIIRNRWIRRSRWQSRLPVKNHLIIVGPALAVHPPPEQAMCLLPRSTLHGFR